MQLTENQRSIAGYEKKYLIDTDGVVRSILQNGSIVTKKTLSYAGFKYVDLFDGVEYKRFRVDRLMGKAFLGTEDVYAKNNDYQDTRPLDRLLPGHCWCRDYVGQYALDDEGNPWSYARNVPKKLKRFTNRVGDKVYECYKLYRNGKPWRIYQSQMNLLRG